MSARAAEIQAQTATHLKQKDIEHLLSEGFGSGDITQLQKGGMRSLTQAEAETMGFRVKDPDGKWQSSPGLYFQFTDTFGQLRADHPPSNSKGKPCKYLTPAGAKAQAWLPDGCKVITEGFKDAAAGTLRGGIPTGALAGVSHYRKALPEGAGHTIVFDADGWENPAVFGQLVQAGFYLKGRIQLIPPIEGEPKAGLCEYFKAGHTAEDYKALIASAMKPKEFMLTLPDHWGKLSAIKQSECAPALLALAAKHLPDMERQCLVAKVRKVTDIPVQTLRSHLNKALLKEALKAERAQKQVEPEPPKQQGLILIASHPETGEPILPKASFIANILADQYRSTLAFNIEQAEFYHYGSALEGQWSLEPREFVRNMIGTALNASGAGDLYSSGYIASVCDLIRDQLAVRRWNETRTNLLPMRNGVLEVATGKFLDHSPGYRFLWQLPYAYNPLATCQPIQAWLLEAQDGDPQRVQLLRAYLKAIVTGRTDLQRYLECLGPGGTGKSTYTRLAIALVGLENTCTTELKWLEGNRFETSSIYGKRLVIVNDAERYDGSVSVLKAMTGQDPLRNEQKHKQQGTGFVPKALVLVAANEAIQANDYTSGLARRRLTIPFLNQVAASQRRDLLTIQDAGMAGEFVDYLPGLLNWVLALPDDAVRELLINTPVSVPSLAQWKAESLLESNPIAEWLDNRVIIDASAKSYVGVAEKIRETSGDPGNHTSRERYLHSNRWLYPSYVQYCHQVGNRPISLKRFVGLLEDLLQSQLGLPITRARDRSGSFFGGIALRDANDDASPSPITKDRVDAANVMGVLGKVRGCDGSVMTEPPVNVGCDGCDGLFNLDIEKAAELYEEEAALHSVSLVPPNCELISSQHASQPSHSTLPGISAVAADAPPITRPITTAATTHHLPKLPHAFEFGQWLADSDPFWYRLAASADTSTVTRKHRALQIRKEWLSVKSAEALKQSKQKWSHEAKFVWNRVLTCAEQRQLEALSQSQQTSIAGFDDVWDEV